MWQCSKCGFTWYLSSREPSYLGCHLKLCISFICSSVDNYPPCLMQVVKCPHCAIYPSDDIIILLHIYLNMTRTQKSHLYKFIIELPLLYWHFKEQVQTTTSTFRKSCYCPRFKGPLYLPLSCWHLGPKPDFQVKSKKNGPVCVLCWPLKCN